MDNTQGSVSTIYPAGTDQSVNGQSQLAGPYQENFNGLDPIYFGDSDPNPNYNLTFQSPNDSQTPQQTANYVPNVATDGIDAVIAYNKKMLGIDTSTTIDADAVQNFISAPHDLASGSLGQLGSSISSGVSDFFNKISFVTILIIGFALFLVYTVVKNADVKVAV